MKKILLIIMLSICLCGCSEKNIINQEYIDSIVKSKDYVILDVRTKEEYNASHIKDSINLPHNEINEDIDIEKSKIIFVYCKSGNRSNVAYTNLSKLGYTVYDLGAISEIKLPIE